jgi:zinc protease
MSATLHTLPNGLRVVHEAHPGRLASVQLWFDAGTADEGPDERGAAHLLEHMLFKGSARYGLGEAASTIEAHGGDLNAYTTWDQTVLQATVMAEAWTTAVDVVADMAWRSHLDAEELEREKGVVLEEIRGYAADPESVVDDAVTGALFGGHPYGSPVLGTEASVRGIDRLALARFWRRHYSASRAVLAVAGPMTAEAVIEVAAALVPFPATERQVEAPATPALPRLLSVAGDFDTPVVSVVFRGPGDGHPDLPALEVLASALGAGRGAILPSLLRFGPEPSVADIWTGAYARRRGGSFEIGFIPLPETASSALDAVLEVVARPDALTATDLQRGRDNLVTERLFAAESVESVAHDLAWFTGRAGTPAARDTWYDELAAVTPAQVRDAARRWLQDPMIATLGTGPLAPSTSPPARPATARIVHVDRHLDAGPIGSLYLSWPGGLQAETRETSQLTDAWSALVVAGAGSTGNVAFARALDAVGASIRTVAGRSTLGLQLTAPVGQFDAAADLLAQVVQQPRFEQHEWQRYRDEVLLDLERLDDRPEEVLSRRIWQLAFPDHPWGVPRNRTNIRRLRRQAVADFHDRWITDAPVVGVGGPVPDPAGIVGRVVAGRSPHPVAFDVPTPGPQPTGHFTSRAGQEQALICAVTRAPSLHHPDLHALRVGVALLAAQSGPLFLELRERRSLAYHVWASMAESPSHGLLMVGLATDPRRHLAARRALLDALDRFIAEGPSPDAVTRTIAMLRGQAASSDQSAARRAMRHALAGVYGLDPTVAAAEAALEAVDAAAVHRAFTALPPVFTVTVRPR